MELKISHGLILWGGGGGHPPPPPPSTLVHNIIVQERNLSQRMYCFGRIDLLAWCRNSISWDFYWHAINVRGREYSTHVSGTVTTIFYSGNCR